MNAGPKLRRDHGPFPNGVKYPTIEEAEKAAGFHFTRPQHDLANDSVISAVFLERVQGDPSETVACLTHDTVHAAIDYISGILITIENVAGTACPFDVDPSAAYASMAKGWPGWQATSINGEPAILIPEDSTGPAVVSVTTGGEWITIYPQYVATEVPLSTMTEIAETLG